MAVRILVGHCNDHYRSQMVATNKLKLGSPGPTHHACIYAKLVRWNLQLFLEQLPIAIRIIMLLRYFASVLLLSLAIGYLPKG